MVTPVLENAREHDASKCCETPRAPEFIFRFPHQGEIMRIGRLVASVSTAVALAAVALVAGGGTAVASALSHI